VRQPRPQLACCNFLPEAGRLRQLARDLDLQGVDWTLPAEAVAATPRAEAELTRELANLSPLEVRFHLAFPGVDLGAEDPGETHWARSLYREACRLLSKVGARYVTIHLGGLGRESSADLSWPAAVAGLTELVQFAHRLGLRLCVENLAWGWSSRPRLYEKLLRLSGAFGTLDVGHAQVSPAVQSGVWRVEDFISPHPDRILQAHVYHVETEEGHQPPWTLAQMEARLRLLESLPLCRWWVLELHDEAGLRQTRAVVEEYFQLRAEEEGTRGRWPSAASPKAPCPTPREGSGGG